MEYISATEARASFSDVIDAAQKQPVVIQRQNKDVAVMISPEEYDKLRQIHIKELQDISKRVSARAKVIGLTEEKLSQLLDEDD